MKNVILALSASLLLASTATAQMVGDMSGDWRLVMFHTLDNASTRSVIIANWTNNGSLHSEIPLVLGGNVTYSRYVTESAFYYSYTPNPLWTTYLDPPTNQNTTEFIAARPSSPIYYVAPGKNVTVRAILARETAHMSWLNTFFSVVWSRDRLWETFSHREFTES